MEDFPRSLLGPLAAGVIGGASGGGGRAGGAGLGLSIVQAIADAHGAAIAAHPRPDGGLEVEVTCPVPAAQV
jgi:signal transduction histidine kinase